jgi:paraquat-inducible protein B
MVNSIDGEISPLSEKAQALLDESNKALENMSLMTLELRNVVAPESKLYVELTEAMQDFSSAARWVGELAEFLSRNPKALISGKKLPQE